MREPLEGRSSLVSRNPGSEARRRTLSEQMQVIEKKRREEKRRGSDLKDVGHGRPEEGDDDVFTVVK